MSLYFHGNAPLKFQHQYLVTLNYIIPYLEAKKVFREGMKVLEIGCGEGGVLKAFIERGCICTGMDLFLHQYIDIYMMQINEYIIDNQHQSS